MLIFVAAFYAVAAVYRAALSEPQRRLAHPCSVGSVTTDTPQHSFLLRPGRVQMGELSSRLTKDKGERPHIGRQSKLSLGGDCGLA